MSKQMKGRVITLLAGIFWGISGVSGQFLMAEGVHVNLLTSIRLLVAGVILVSLVLVREPASLSALFNDKVSLLRLLVFSLFGLTLNQFAYLQAIAHTNSATATVLQYLAPVLLLVLVCVKEWRLPRWVEVLVIFLALTGTVMLATRGDLSSLTMAPTGLFWGIFSAFTYVAYMLLPGRLMSQWGSLLIIGVGMLFGGLVFSTVTQAFQHEAHLSLTALPAYVGIVGIGTVLAYVLFLKGASLVGPVKASLLSAIEPVSAVIFTVLVFKEAIYAIDLLGMAVIIVAVSLMAWQELKAQ